MHCLKDVIWFKSYVTGIEKFKAYLTWTCTNNDCNCWGEYKHLCYSYSLEISAKGGSSGLPPVTDCKYGDTVQLTNLESDWLAMYEIVIIERGTKSAFDFRNCISFDVIPCK